MAYRKSRKTSGRGRKSYSGRRRTTARRRAPARRGGGSQTIKLVIEQPAAPAPIRTPESVVPVAQSTVRKARF